MPKTPGPECPPRPRFSSVRQPTPRTHPNPFASQKTLACRLQKTKSMTPIGPRSFLTAMSPRDLRSKVSSIINRFTSIIKTCFGSRMSSWTAWEIVSDDKGSSAYRSETSSMIIYRCWTMWSSIWIGIRPRSMGRGSDWALLSEKQRRIRSWPLFWSLSASWLF